MFYSLLWRLEKAMAVSIPRPAAILRNLSLNHGRIVSSSLRNCHFSITVRVFLAWQGYFPSYPAWGGAAPPSGVEEAQRSAQTHVHSAQWAEGRDTRVRFLPLLASWHCMTWLMTHREWVGPYGIWMSADYWFHWIESWWLVHSIEHLAFMAPMHHS